MENDSPFGNKIIVLLGDLCQTCPVICWGSHAGCLNQILTTLVWFHNTPSSQTLAKCWRHPICKLCRCHWGWRRTRCFPWYVWHCDRCWGHYAICLSWSCTTKIYILTPSCHSCTNKPTSWPLQWCYLAADTLKEANDAGVDLTWPVFSHGQMYTALSHIRHHNNAKVHLHPGETTTPNVTYQEILIRLN